MTKRKLKEAEAPVEAPAPTGTKLRHDYVRAVDPKGTSNRRWKCQVCQSIGTLDALMQTSCIRQLTDEERLDAVVDAIEREV
jgi:hypothetical protein